MTQEKLNKNNDDNKDSKEKKGEEKENNEQLLKKIDQLKKENEELRYLVKRIAADFDNYKKRMEIEKEEMIKLSSKKIIMKLLPILDNFELALKNTENHESFVKGVELIYSMLLSSLEEEGLKSFLPQEFDPNYCEVILIKEVNKKEMDNKVLEVIQKGYALNKNIIRPAKVIIGKYKSEKNEEKNNN